MPYPNGIDSRPARRHGTAPCRAMHAPSKRVRPLTLGIDRLGRDRNPANADRGGSTRRGRVDSITRSSPCANAKGLIDLAGRERNITLEQGTVWRVRDRNGDGDGGRGPPHTPQPRPGNESHDLHAIRPPPSDRARALGFQGWTAACVASWTKSTSAQHHAYCQRPGTFDADVSEEGGATSSWADPRS